MKYAGGSSGYLLARCCCLCANQVCDIQSDTKSAIAARLYHDRSEPWQEQQATQPLRLPVMTKARPVCLFDFAASDDSLERRVPRGRRRQRGATDHDLAQVARAPVDDAVANRGQRLRSRAVAALQH